MREVLFRICVVLIALWGPTLLAADGDGPTPYPDPKEEKAWPGQGPIRLHPWMKDNRAAFWKQRDAAQGAVVFTGDSLTGNWKLDSMKASFPKLKIANRGIGGDVSRGLLFRFREDVLDLKPRALVLLIGTNDLSAHAAPAGVLANIATLLDLARKENPTLPIVLCTIPPREAANAPLKPGALADVNKGIAALAKNYELLALLDLNTLLAQADGSIKAECFTNDRLHLAPPGYQLWADALQPVFAKLGVE